MELDIHTYLQGKIKDYYYNNIEPFLNVKLLSCNPDNNIWTVKYIDNDKNVFIYAGNDFPNIYSLAHEILHLYLFINDFTSSSPFSYLNYKKLPTMLINSTGTTDTIDGLANAIAHNKMLPLYTEIIGFDKANFYANWDRTVYDYNINTLKSRNNLRTNNEVFTNYIRFFFDMRFNISDTLKVEYATYTNDLRSIDNNLFKILDEVCISWEQSPGYNNIVFFNNLYMRLENYL